MRILFLLFSILFCSESHASFSYSEVANQLGLSIVSIGTPWTFPGVHRLYTHPSFNSAMLVIENVKGVKTKLEITEFDKFTLVEYPVSPKEYNSVALINISKTDIETSLNTPTVYFQNTLKSFMSIFVPTAHANDQCGLNSGQNIDDGFGGLMDFFSTGYFQLGSSCIVGILEGIWAATGELAQSSWDGLVNLVSDPKSFWDEKVTQFGRLKNLLLNFETTMQKTFATFKTLPDETKAQMLCSFIGSIGTDVLISVLTLGAGMTKVLASIGSYVAKILKIEDLISKLSKMGKLAEIPAKFYSHLAKGLISEKRLHSIQSLSHYEFDDLATQLVRCSL